ncbi:hypothetical protein ACOKWQ_003824 [Vibrio parahaemolyticus]|uniref:hypothetical protein n=1 Tax=Vibrio rotiferianus TaxID=190895 RepID=UPI0039095762|nr:hypothetical protein [Vibrio parahaemolyticus]
MNFWQTLLSSGLGAAFGSIVAGIISLLIFYHQVKKQRQEEFISTKQCLKHELEYNLIVYSQQISELEKIMTQLETGSRDIVVNLEYEYVLGFYSKKAYKNGVFAEYLSPEEMYQWNKSLSLIMDGKQASIVSDIEAWNNKQLDDDVVKRSVYHEYSCLYEAKTFGEKFIERL